MSTVRKTYKLFINGAFPRGESGRVSELVHDGVSYWVCNASRKDARDAISAAQSASSSWGSQRQMLRGQILYRAGEMLACRTDIAGHAQAAKRFVWWAGWADKLTSVLSHSNPVSGFSNTTNFESAGVVTALLDAENEEAFTVELCDAIGAALCAGNTIVAVVPVKYAAQALCVAETLSVSDIPAGCVNILTSDQKECAVTVVSHGDVSVIDAAAHATWGLSQLDVLEQSEAHMPRANFNAWESENHTRASFALDAKTTWQPLYQ